VRTVQISIYNYNELSDKAKERARDWYRCIRTEYAWMDESQESITTYCKLLGAEVDIQAISPDRANYSVTLEEQALAHIAATHDLPHDYMPTGYVLDCDLWGTFHDKLRETNDPVVAFHEGLKAGFLAWRHDLQYQDSDEYIADGLTVNEYEFDETGERAHYK
jgi:hypothetical protein